MRFTGNRNAPEGARRYQAFHLRSTGLPRLCARAPDLIKAPVVGAGHAIPEDLSE